MNHQQPGGNDDNRDEEKAEELWEAIQNPDYAAEEADPDDFYPGVVDSDALSPDLPEEDDPTDHPTKG